MLLVRRPGAGFCVVRSAGVEAKRGFCVVAPPGSRDEFWGFPRTGLPGDLWDLRAWDEFRGFPGSDPPGDLWGLWTWGEFQRGPGLSFGDSPKLALLGPGGCGKETSALLGSSGEGGMRVRRSPPPNTVRFGSLSSAQNEQY